MAANDMKELPIIVKADVQGSAEAVKQSLEKISNDEVRVRVIHAGVGAISKSDVSLADASNAIIIGFNVRPDAVTKAEAEQTGVEMRMYRVIYDAINDVSDAMKGMLAPKVREVAPGRGPGPPGLQDLQRRHRRRLPRYRRQNHPRRPAASGP